MLVRRMRSSRLVETSQNEPRLDERSENMERFARIIVGYHGCSETFARKLLLGEQPIGDWKPSENQWDWLGKGIYFWEHSPERALRWAQETLRGRRGEPAVIGAVIQLGQCFDLMNEGLAAILEESFKELVKAFEVEGQELPTNERAGGKRRTRLPGNQRLPGTAWEIRPAIRHGPRSLP